MIIGIFLFAAMVPEGVARQGVMLLLEVAALVLALWNSGLSQNVAIGALFGAFGVLIAGAALLDHGSVADGKTPSSSR